MINTIGKHCRCKINRLVIPDITNHPSWCPKLEHQKTVENFLAENAYDLEFAKKYPALDRLTSLNILNQLRDQLELKKSQLKQVKDEVRDLIKRIDELTKELTQ